MVNLARILISLFLLQKKVEKGNNPVPDQESIYHHIIPNCELSTLIPPKSDGEELRMQKLNQYLNKPHIKSVIIDNDLTNPDNNHGEVIHAAIANNPHNLVYGPNPNHRCKDPKSGLDDKILEAQRHEYKTAVNTYQQNKTLESFGNIPASEPVEWEKHEPQQNQKATVDKYHVKDQQCPDPNQGGGKGGNSSKK